MGTKWVMRKKIKKDSLIENKTKSVQNTTKGIVMTEKYD